MMAITTKSSTSVNAREFLGGGVELNKESNPIDNMGTAFSKTSESRNRESNTCAVNPNFGICETSVETERGWLVFLIRRLRGWSRQWLAASSGIERYCESISLRAYGAARTHASVFSDVLACLC